MPTPAAAAGAETSSVGVLKVGPQQEERYIVAVLVPHPRWKAAVGPEHRPPGSGRGRRRAWLVGIAPAWAQWTVEPSNSQNQSSIKTN